MASNQDAGCQSSRPQRNQKPHGDTCLKVLGESADISIMSTGTGTIKEEQGLAMSAPRSPLPVVVRDDSIDAPLTLLIASEIVLNAWRAYAERAQSVRLRVIAVVDRELSGAVDVIRLQQPGQIIVEQAFAASGRGAPLMTLLYDQRRLRGTQIRLLTPERVSDLLSSQPGQTPLQTWLTAFAYPLPPRPSQRAPRIRVPADHRILIDGHPEVLVDVSTLGAQIRGTLALHPGQPVNVMFQPGDDSLKVSGVVVWSMFELSPTPCYRAGIAFSTAIREGLADLPNRSQPSPQRRVGNLNIPFTQTELGVCGMCHGTRPASRMATLMGRRLCFDCATECYDGESAQSSS